MPIRKNPTSTYFTLLELENVRCFADKQALDLTVSRKPARWTLIVGDNGVGKTTLLQALAWMRLVPDEVPESPLETDDDFGNPPPIKQGTVQPALEAEENYVFERLRRIGRHVEFRMGVTLVVGGQLSPHPAHAQSSQQKARSISARVRVTFQKDRLRKVKYGRLPTVETDFAGEFNEPLVVTYGANRPLGASDLAPGAVDDPTETSRLSELTPLYDVEEILTDLDHASARNPNGREAKELNRLKEVLVKMLPEALAAEDIEIFPPDVLDSGRPSGVHVNTFSGQVPMSSLSLGYQTTLAWTTDLAWRLLRRYPGSNDPLSEPAIVLIDEIDLHLHPRWQLKIIDDLSSVFTGTQFVATAHSPLMVQVAQDANLVLLQRRTTDVEIVNDPEVVRSWRVDQILNSPLFGIPRTRDPLTEALFERRDELLDLPARTSDQEAEFESLQRQISALPTAQSPEDQEAMEFIRKAAAILKNREVGAES